MRALFFCIAVLFATWAQAQPTLRHLVEFPLGLSEANTSLFLTGALGGRQPISQLDPESFIGYDLDSNTVHIEYKSRQGICSMVAVKFTKNEEAFLTYQKTIVATATKANGQQWTTTGSGKTVVYEFYSEDCTLWAMTPEYAAQHNNPLE